jgi:hypothetical protein
LVQTEATLPSLLSARCCGCREEGQERGGCREQCGSRGCGETPTSPRCRDQARAAWSLQRRATLLRVILCKLVKEYVAARPCITLLCFSLLRFRVELFPLKLSLSRYRSIARSLSFTSGSCPQVRVQKCIGAQRLEQRVLPAVISLTPTYLLNLSSAHVPATWFHSRELCENRGLGLQAPLRGFVI